ncbi:NAD(P)/FAD-dependent oxidoreductase [Prosthecomicrobium sp. N25]|uniref:NAD(P)/FAD-dependent oxidoreductase n=1 Tax=Prosthecomicrobium sp. N25 TaxID=3129254 RepID=UPI003076E22F
MRITIDPFEGDAELPAKSEVVVIGGGIIGVTTALFLALRGVEVTLCEKGGIAQEQSGRNWGWVRVMGRDPGEIPLGLVSQTLWEKMSELTNAELGFRRAGILYVADTEKELAAQVAWLDHAKIYGIESRVLRGAQLEALIPGVRRRFVGGLYTPADARAEPQKAVPAMAEVARRFGARILTNCAVRGLETKAGQVSGVVTERGAIACSTVVLAGGAWSRLFLGNLGIDFPQLKLLGSVLRTEPLEGPPTLAVGGSDFAFRKRLDGGYSVARRNASVAEVVPDSFRLFADFFPSLVKQRGELRLRVGRRFIEEASLARRWQLDERTPFEQVRALDPEPSQGLLDEGLANVKAAFPAFAEARVAGAWGGLVDAMPDAVPVIGWVPRYPGLLIASGFSGHGFGIGPGAGHLVADLVTGAKPIVDPLPYRPERFPRLARTIGVGRAA